MYIEGQKSWIFGSDNRARWHKNGKKVQGVIDWLVSRNVKDMQKFLELANYYRQFIKGFTRVAKPLHKIIRKDINVIYKFTHPEITSPQ